MVADAGEGDPSPLDEFSKRLDKARGAPREQKARENGGANRSDGAEMGRGLKIASELLAAFLVGLFAGWGLDKVFDTAPWATLVGVGLGFAAGVLNVHRAMAKMDEGREPSADGETQNK